MSPLPPGPPASSYVQAMRFSKDPTAFLEGMQQRFGPIFTMKLANNPAWVVVASAEGLKDVLDLPTSDFTVGETAVMVEFLVGRNSLLLLDGARHSRERKLMMPHLHGQRIAAYGERMRALTLAAIRRWPPREPIEALSTLQALSLDILLECVFGVPPGPERDQYRDVLVRFLEQSMTPLAITLWSSVQGEKLRAFFVERLAPIADALERPFGLDRLVPGADLARTVREIEDLIYRDVRRRRAEGPGRDDLISMLLASRDENGEGLTDAELHDEMLTMLIAGHESTATTATWALWEILRDEGVHGKLLQELNEKFGAGEVDLGRFNELPYLDAIVRETMRLHPVSPGISRKLQRPARIAGHEIPAGTILAPSLYLVHRDPKVWPSPDRFDPTRFLDRKPKYYEYIPFGAGLRTCAGMAFAMFEMKLILTLFLRHARLRLDSLEPLRHVTRGVIFGPSNKVPLVLIERPG